MVSFSLYYPLKIILIIFIFILLSLLYWEGGWWREGADWNKQKFYTKKKVFFLHSTFTIITLHWTKWGDWLGCVSILKSRRINHGYGLRHFSFNVILHFPLSFSPLKRDSVCNNGLISLTVKYRERISPRITASFPIHPFIHSFIHSLSGRIFVFKL